MISFIICSTVTVCTIILWFIYHPFYWRNKAVPYLFPLPLIGNCLPIIIGNYRGKYPDYLYNQYPNEKFYGLHFFLKPTLVIKDPAIIKDIFVKDFEYFPSGGWYLNQKDDPMHDSVLFLHGEEWKDVRGKLRGQFTPIKLRTMSSYVDKSIKKMFEIMEKSIENDQTEEIDLMRLLHSTATDVAVQTLFGFETDSFNKDSNFYTLGSGFLKQDGKTLKLMSTLSEKLNNLIKLRVYKKDEFEFLKNFIDTAIDYRKKNNIEMQDFLQTMINHMESNKENDEKVKYFPDKTRVPVYNYKRLLSQAVILTVGGLESISSVMSLALYELAKNQQIQDRCRQEIVDIYNETGADVQSEEIHKLKYLDMVIKETFRKHTTFPQLHRECKKTYKIRDTNVIIEPGTLIVTLVQHIHSDPKFFKDPEKFIPERFSPENKGTLDPGTYMPWGLGPKSCLGKNIAQMQIFLILSRVLRNFKFTLSNKRSDRLLFVCPGVGRRPANGIWLQALPIHN